MAFALSANRAFPPLDDQLGVLAGHRTPTLHAWLVRLSAYVPFAQAASLLREFAYTKLSEASAQRLTCAAGTTLVEAQPPAAHAIIETAPAPRPGPSCLLLRADGAMVPLVAGAWAAVKTLGAGVVEAQPRADGVPLGATSQLSSFSRLRAAATVRELVTVATYARGVERAGTVVAVRDGAEWIQRLFDLQCPDAVRILDFPHAAQRLSHRAATVWGAGSAQTRDWQTVQIHALKHRGPSGVLAALAELGV